jgi:HK97 family phage prohead protease
MAKTTVHAGIERTRTVEVTPLELRATIATDTVDEENRTVEIIWTTGARVLRASWDIGAFWEELSLESKHVRMDRIDSGAAPLLNTHSQWDLRDVIGVVESGRLQKKQGTAKVRFAKAEDDPEADKIFRKVKDKIIRNVSVGYRVHKMEKVEDGADKTPVYRVTDWTPYEISIVPIGADAGAMVRSSAPERNQCVIVTRQEMKMQDRDDEDNGGTNGAAAGSAGGSTVDEITRDARQARINEAKTRAASEQAAAEAARDEERLRVSEITTLGKRWKMGDAWIANMVAVGASVSKAQRAILEHGAGDDETFNPSRGASIEAGEDASQKFRRGALAAILQRTGYAQTIRDASKKCERLAHHFKDVSLEPNEFGSMRMLDIARKSIELRGGSTKGVYGEDLIRKALEYRADSGFNTTSDFSILLEAVPNKIFLSQYALAPVTWPLWCGRKSVNDFKASTFYRPGTFGVLDAVTEAGEVKHKNIPDGEKRTLTPSTKGNIIGITRKALVNDDLGAFTSLAAGLGLTAAFTVEADAFAMVTANSGLGLSYDANPLFHSSRSNIGPTGAMSVTTWDGARAAMAKQKDPSANQFLALRPQVWLGPVELGGSARQLNTSTADPRDSKNSGVRNMVESMVQTIVDSPYLSASSATRHYFLADPGLFPVFAVGFINGMEAPTMETYQSFNYDGVQMKIILDYGTAALDYRGSITCAGA